MKNHDDNEMNEYTHGVIRGEDGVIREPEEPLLTEMFETQSEVEIILELMEMVRRDLKEANSKREIVRVMDFQNQLRFLDNRLVAAREAEREYIPELMLN